MKYFTSLLFLLSLALNAQDHHARLESINVLHYRFEIDLSDSSDVIWCRATLDIHFKKELNEFTLDLSMPDTDRSGMHIDELKENGRKIPYVHREEKIQISAHQVQPGETREYQISYHGIPSDGLIISENKFGDRTFFGDNWPNRAHHWLPVVDHPSDKATVEFLVHAPSHYGVVANGSICNENTNKGWTTTHWKTTVPLPTKLMVIGVSPFVVQNLRSSSGIPVSSWVYPQNRKEGFYDYRIATRPLDFFESYIAPYPYTKLANVQSKTVYGGMENASCIFYREGSVTGLRKDETLFAHEIAHQWFGDAVSEMDWHHIWISEGFATYLTDLYIEHTRGREAFVASMLDEKDQVLRFARRRLAPIIDTTLPVSVRLLNKNSYEKGGWALHMLRRELGDTLFQECIQNFYEEYKFGNALTGDFQKVVEILSGRSFEDFFQQWFFQAGHPVISATWKKRGKKIHVKISQHQKQFIFDFPLDIKLVNDKGESFTETLSIQAPVQDFTLHPSFKPSKLILDPDSWLLFESYKSP
ncbi:MAG: M1 family metallopeptidase [Bacteroidota bacterium]